MIPTLVSQNADVIVPSVDVAITGYSLSAAIQDRSNPRSSETINYKILYLSSSLFGVASGLLSRRGFRSRPWELLSYGAYAVGTMSNLRVETGHFEAAARIGHTPIGRRQWWLGVAGVTLCGLQALQSVWVAIDASRKQLALIGTGTRLFGIGVCLAAKAHKRTADTH